MKQWSFIFWTLLSTLFVGVAYLLNTNTPLQIEASASKRTGTVLVASTQDTNSSVAVQNRVALLDGIAQLRAEDMRDNNYYSHKTPEGLYFFNYFQTVGIASDTPGCENLLLLKSGLSREQVYEQWRASPDHNACLTAGHASYGYAEKLFDPDLGLSVYVYIAASL